MTNKPIKLCVFFTFLMSLKRWKDEGIFEREVFYYKELQKQGFEITFVTYANCDDFAFEKEMSGIKVFPLFSEYKKLWAKPFLFFLSFWQIWKKRQFFKSFDIFKSNQMHGSCFALFAARLLKKPFILRCGYELYHLAKVEKQSFLKRAWLYGLSRLSYHMSHSIILSSENVSQNVQRYFSIKPEKIVLNPNYIDTKLFKPEAKSKKHNSRIVFVGRLHFHKNLLNLLRAAKKLSLGLDLVGKGELRSEIEALAKELEADVRFLGYFPNEELPKIFNQYRFFALPSISEGNPKTLLEAMSCGLAVVGNDVSGINNIIEDKTNGLLCDGTAEGLEEAFSLLLKDTSLEENIALRARDYVLKNCSLKQSIEIEKSVYQKFTNIDGENLTPSKSSHWSAI